jgi:hypothetical protein
MKIKINISLIISIPKLQKHFDLRPCSVLDCVRPDVTIEKITDGYEKK